MLTWHVKYFIVFCCNRFSYENKKLWKCCIMGFSFVCLLIFVSLRYPISVSLNMTVSKITAKLIAANLCTSKRQIYKKTCLEAGFVCRLGMELKSCTKGPLYSECFSWKNANVSHRFIYHFHMTSPGLSHFCLCVVQEGCLSLKLNIEGVPLIFKWILLFAICGVFHTSLNFPKAIYLQLFYDP